MRVKKKQQQPLASQRLKESALSKSNFTVSNVYLSVSAAAFSSFTQLMAIFVEQSTFISSSSFHLQLQLELQLHLHFQRPVPKLPVNAADQQFRYNIAYRIIMSSASWLLWPQNGDTSNSSNSGSNSNCNSNNMQHQQHRRHLFSHLVWMRTPNGRQRHYLAGRPAGWPVDWRRYSWSSFVC